MELRRLNSSKPEMLEGCRNVSFSMDVVKEFQESFVLEMQSNEPRRKNSNSRLAEKKTSNGRCFSASKPTIKVDEYVEMSATRKESMAQGVGRATLIYVKEKSSHQPNLDKENLSRPRKATATGSIPEQFDQGPSRSADDVVQENDPHLEREKLKLPKSRKKRRGRSARTTENPISLGDLQYLGSKREKSKSIHVGRLDPSMKTKFSFMHNLDSEKVAAYSFNKTYDFCPIYPVEEEVFPISLSAGLASGASFNKIQKLPPIQRPFTRRSKSTTMTDPPSSELEVRKFLPALQEQPPFLALEDPSTCLSQSAPPCYHCASPFVSEREKSQSLLSVEPSLTSQSSLYSSSLSTNSSTSSIRPNPSAVFQENEPCHLFSPVPPPRPANEKERNQRWNRRPGRRLVPLNKIDVAPNNKTKEDTQLELTDIEDVTLAQVENDLCSQEAEIVSAKERRKIEEYQRLCSDRRKGICEELESNTSIMKINGKRYNLTMLRHELTKMTKAVSKYSNFFKNFSSFVNKERQ